MTRTERDDSLPVVAISELVSDPTFTTLIGGHLGQEPRLESLPLAGSVAEPVSSPLRAAPEAGRSSPLPAPAFMLSYARPVRGAGADTGPIRKFHDDLFEELGYLAPRIQQGRALGFDQEMPLGTDWQRRLAYDLAHCRSLVPLVSTPFFDSEWCGKEWSVFTQRRVVTRPPVPQDAHAVVPVIWVPVPPERMHPVVQRLQYTNQNLPTSYVRDGLLALSRRDGRNSRDYRRVVNGIATRIAELIQHSTVEPGRVVNLDTAPNAFLEAKGHPDWSGVRFWHEEEGSEIGDGQ
ncbi:TIR-like protein FxsC [Streptacidiphilus sp. PAMC 29251]